MLQGQQRSMDSDLLHAQSELSGVGLSIGLVVEVVQVGDGFFTSILGKTRVRGKRWEIVERTERGGEIEGERLL